MWGSQNALFLELHKNKDCVFSLKQLKAHEKRDHTLRHLTDISAGKKLLYKTSLS